MITAGWQEREDEDQELRSALDVDLVNLRLYSRTERLMKSDPKYFSLHRRRQDRMRTLQRLYRARLNPTVQAPRSLLRRSGPPDLLDPEREDAIEAVRALDRHHLGRVSAELASFEAAVRPGERAAIASERREVADIVAGCSAVLIAGGHIAVLLNRLELFDIASLLPGRPIFAWSAGAMAMTDRVVLFHDHPPQGAGDSEMLQPGLGLVPDLVVLPHARHRLRLDDPHRVTLMTRRLLPARCVPLDEGDRVVWSDGALQAESTTRWMAPDGSVSQAVAP